MKIKYAELRSITESVIDFVSKEYWWEKDSTLKTEIETDLGISGDDAWELMQKFSKKYSVDLTNFKFDRYFTPEGAHSSWILWIPVYLSSYVIWIIKVVITILIYPFNKRLGGRLTEYSAKSMIIKMTDSFDYPKLQSMTIADLVTSAACGEFIKRDSIRFEM